MYSFFEPDLVLYLLEGKLRSAEQKQTKTERVNTGPAQQDRNLAFFSDQADCFLQQTNDKPASSPRKKIIISGGLLANQAPTPLEVLLIQSIIRRHDVYLYKGSAENINQYSPLNDSSEFWEKRATIVPATEDTVKETLSTQGIAAKNFQIIDFIEYQKIKQRALIQACQQVNIFHPPDELDFDRIYGIDEDKFYESIAKEKLKKISITNPSAKQIRLLTQYFSGVAICLRKVSQEWVNAHLRKFDLHEVTLDIYQNTSLSIPTPHPKKLKITNTLYLSELNTESDDIDLEFHPKPVKLNWRYLLEIHKEDTKEKNIDTKYSIKKNELMNRYYPIELVPELRTVDLEYHFVPNGFAENDYKGLKRGVSSQNGLLSFSIETRKESKEHPNWKLIQNKPTQPTTINPLPFNVAGCVVSEPGDIKKLGKQITTAEVLTIFYDKAWPDYNQLFTNIKKLICVNLDLNSIDFKNFPNLEELHLIACTGYNNFVDVFLKKLKCLSIHYASHCTLPITLDNFPALESLQTTYGNITLGKSKKLIALDLSGVQHKSFKDGLNLSGYPALESAYISLAGNWGDLYTNPYECETKNSNLILNNLPKLKKLVLIYKDYPIPYIYLYGCRALQYIGLSTSTNCELNLSGLTKLSKLHVNAPTVKINHLDKCYELSKLISSTRQLSLAPAILPPNCELDIQGLKFNFDIKETDKKAVSPIPGVTLFTTHEEIEALENAHAASFANKRSPVSRFAIRKKLRTDAPTQKIEAHSANGVCKFTLFNANGTSKERYRIEIFDQIHFENEELIFASDLKNHCQPLGSALPIQTLTTETIPTLKPKPQKMSGLYEIEGALEKDEFYSLPTDSPLTRETPFEIYCNPTNAITLFWHPLHQQYYFQINENTPNHLFIFYHYDKTYYYKPKIADEIKQGNSLLPQELIQRVDSIKKTKGLEFLASTESITKKIQQLATFCLSFDSYNKLKILPDSSSIDILLACIQQKIGVCRHRAEAFMLLASYMGVSAQMIANETHQFCQVPFKNGLAEFELGGRDLNDISDDDDRINNLENLFQNKKTYLSRKSYPLLNPVPVASNNRCNQIIDILFALCVFGLVSSLLDAIYPNSEGSELETNAPNLDYRFSHNETNLDSTAADQTLSIDEKVNSSNTTNVTQAEETSTLSVSSITNKIISASLNSAEIRQTILANADNIAIIATTCSLLLLAYKAFPSIARNVKQYWPKKLMAGSDTSSDIKSDSISPATYTNNLDSKNDNVTPISDTKNSDSNNSIAPTPIANNSESKNSSILPAPSTKLSESNNKNNSTTPNPNNTESTNKNVSIVRAADKDLKDTKLDAPKPDKTTLRSQYGKTFADSLKNEKFTSFEKILTQKPLIQLPKNADVLTLYPKIIAEIKTLQPKHEIFYIHSPDEFNSYLFPFREEQGSRQRTEGPIAKIINEGGTLLVNWSNFSPTQIVIYQSILDEKPTLGTTRFAESKPIHVVGLITSETECCSAFKSRCKPFEMTSDHPLLSQAPSKNEAKNNNPSVITLDLCHRLNWRDHFIQDVIYIGNKIKLINRSLLTAVTDKQAIHIINPPNDPKFLMLLHRIQHEKRFFHNGQYIEIPSELTITTENKLKAELWNRLNETVVTLNPEKIISLEHKDEKDVALICEDTKTIPAKKRLNIGLYNLHECYETTIVNKKKQAFTLNTGYLDSFPSTQVELYLTDSIPRASWDILMERVNTLHQANNKLTYQFILAPQAAIEGIITHVASEKVPPGARVSFSSDADFHSLKLVKQNQAHIATLVIHVTPQTSFEDLISKLHIEQQPSHVDFIYAQKGLLQALKRGYDVILNGELSARLYQQLLPYLTPNTLIINNGNSMEITGKLFAVMPESAKENLSLNKCATIEYRLNDYIDELKSEVLDHKNSSAYRPLLQQQVTIEDSVNKLQQLYSFARKIPNRGEGYPKPPELNFARLKNLLAALNDSKLHPHNPIKSVFHYDYKRSENLTDPANEDFAFLNVVAKILFKPRDLSSVKLNKLTQLQQHLQTIAPSEWPNYLWQLFNCYSGPELLKKLDNDPQQALHDLRNLPLDAKQIDTLFFRSIPHDIKQTEKSNIDKHSLQLEIMLKESRLVMLKGEPGVGKTFAVKKLQSEGALCFDAHPQSIRNWLTAKPNSPTQKIVLLIDEGNMEKPGTWDFLKAACQTHNSNIYYKGKFYPLLSVQHKIILTGNPENFPGRNFHQLIQDYGRVIFLKKPTDKDLRDKIIGPLLKEHQPEVITQFIAAYHLIKKLNPTYVYSNRDLMSAAQRYLLLATDANNKNTLAKNIFQACLGEFAGTISNLAERNEFTQQLATKFSLPTPFKSSNELVEIVTNHQTHFIPKESEYLIQAIEQDLRIRDTILAEAKSSSYHKQITLVEGEPGLGKSTNYRIVLDKLGFKEKTANPKDDHPDPKKRYVEINAGDANAHQALAIAFKEGSVVILNELNLDKTLEKPVIDFLERAHESPGFKILASQNPSHTAGRESVSPAIRNRAHLLYMNPYSSEALLAITSKRELPEPEIFVDEFQKSGATMRTFYKEINKYPYKKSMVINRKGLFADTKDEKESVPCHASMLLAGHPVPA